MIQGLVTALITPFNPSDAVDEEGLRQNIRFQYANGVDGIAILGTTGEASTLTDDEKRRIIKISREEAPQGTLIVGTGTNSTRQCIANTCEAADLGADYALIIAPYYNKPSQEGIYLHYAAIAQQSPIPLIVYNNPGRTCVNILPETLARIAQLPKIAGIKESSGNLVQIHETIDLLRNSAPHVSVFAGDDVMALAAIALGSPGLISVTSNLLPEAMCALIQAAISGDFSTAREKHFILAPYYKQLFCETNPVPIKAAMQILGLPSGDCRAPLSPLSPSNKQKLLELLEHQKQAVGA